jgi:hypothetical protein
MRIPFPLGYEGVEHLPKTKRVLQNCFNNGSDKIISRPGIEWIKDTNAVARGSFTWNGALYHVLSQQLVKITNLETGAYSVIGTIEGPEPIETDIGFNEAVIVVKRGKIYTLDDEDTLTEIDPSDEENNFVPCVDVCHINGRFVYIPADGEPAFFSDVGDAASVQPLSFFDAEELPDKNNACCNFGNTLLIFGTDSIEPFRNGSPIIFQKVNNARINNGYIGGLLEYNSTWLFIGREKGQDFGIYAIGQGQAPKISNEAIDLILDQYTQSELAEAVSGRFKWRGYDIATFTLRRHSFAYFGGNWFLLDTVFDGVSRPWGAGYITQFDGEYYTSFSDKLGRIAKINTDYGERITHIVDMGFEQPDGDWFACQKIQLGIAQGFNSADGSVAIQMSRDGVLYGPHLYRNLGDLGQYNRQLEWNPPGGLGSYQGFMGVRIYTTEDVDFSLDYLSASLR